MYLQREPRYLESLEVEICVDDACKSKRCVWLVVVVVVVVVVVQGCPLL